ncbi:adenylyl-sulfate kinase [Undibacterium sp. TC9W]|uniref:adenylyl-sulfate kinase n=1 Tax=Undibacterium sp. TC9W TaxID=3413053 RepID=UPI003BEFD9A5
MPGSNQTESSAEPAANNVKTWWLSGLPGAGKTTLAQNLARHLREQSIAVCVLDGDEIRQGLSKDLGFSLTDREEQGRRTAEMARLLNLNGISAIVALVSPSMRGRALARGVIGHDKFVEAYISTPLHICQQRDPKGWYAKAKQNPALQLTGVSAPYEAPISAECVIDTSQTDLADAIVQLTSFLRK